MTTQLTEAIESTAEPLSMLQRTMPKEGAQRMSKRGRGEHASITDVPGWHNSIPRCSHYWIIEFAVGPLSKGACKICGEEKLFRNQLRWDEIAPVRAKEGGRQASGSPDSLEQREYHPFLLPRSRYGRPVVV